MLTVFGIRFMLYRSLAYYFSLSYDDSTTCEALPCAAACNHAHLLINDLQKPLITIRVTLIDCFSHYFSHFSHFFLQLLSVFVSFSNSLYCTTAALYPLELIKTRMQVENSGKGAYRSITSSLQIVLKNEGIKGLYSGLTPAIIGSCASWGGYFYFYENAKKRKLANRLPGDNKLQTVDHVS